MRLQYIYIVCVISFKIVHVGGSSFGLHRDMSISGGMCHYVVK